MMAEPEEKKRPVCPYCDEESATSGPTSCMPCEVTTFHCPQCRKDVPLDKQVCPYCGAKIRG
ncbi:zinc-ribbon domain-containing protein [Chloroflexota bacterium]